MRIRLLMLVSAVIAALAGSGPDLAAGLVGV